MKHVSPGIPVKFALTIVVAILLGTVFPTRSALSEDATTKKSNVTVKADEANDQTIFMVVMDPLAAPLSCPCVEGYAQRRYEKLGEYLQQRMKRPVKVVFANALETALKEKTKGRAHIIIGKDSVVVDDCKLAKMKPFRLAALTDKKGLTTQTGLIVVRSSASAKDVKDLAGYRILFGPANCQEKYDAPLAMLKAAGIPLPKKLETSNACSDGACKVVDLGPDAKAAAVISSYAAPLLEGCGTIKKGDLRVVAETKPVPFIAAFATNSVSKKERKQIKEALLDVFSDEKLCKALESTEGFIEVKTKKKKAKNSKGKKEKTAEEAASSAKKK